MYFNVRVYGLLITDKKEVLISDEKTLNISFTKFPGGGLEYGEGLIEALKREFIEECQLEIDVVRHIYTTDFYEKSSFNDSQIISIYYEVRAKSPILFDVKSSPFDFSNEKKREKVEVFRFIPIENLQESDLTFRTDKIAWSQFKKQII